MIKGLMLCQTLCFLWHKVDVFLAQKCGHFSVRFSNLNIENFDRTFYRNKKREHFRTQLRNYRILRHFQRKRVLVRRLLID